MANDVCDASTVEDIYALQNFCNSLSLLVFSKAKSIFLQRF